MPSLASYAAGGLAAVLALDLLAPGAVTGGTSELLGRVGFPVGVSAAEHGVDRTLKADRLVPARAAQGEKPMIVAVEIVGLRNTAIVYRDRAGRELFRTDPVTNATVVAKGIVLPEVTIRESGASKVDPVPVNSPQAPLPDRRKLPIGCESPVSPLAESAPPNLIGRCISGLSGARFAALTAASPQQSSR
jgi:hypothetical protein